VWFGLLSVVLFFFLLMGKVGGVLLGGFSEVGGG